MQGGRARAAEVEAFSAAISASHLAGYIRETRQRDLDTVELMGGAFEIRH